MTRQASPARTEAERSRSACVGMQRRWTRRPASGRRRGRRSPARGLGGGPICSQVRCGLQRTRAQRGGCPHYGQAPGVAWKPFESVEKRSTRRSWRSTHGLTLKAPLRIMRGGSGWRRRPDPRSGSCRAAGGRQTRFPSARRRPGRATASDGGPALRASRHGVPARTRRRMPRITRRSSTRGTPRGL